MTLHFVILATAASLLVLGARRKKMEIGTMTLNYWELGPVDGEPWVLLHGLGSVAVTWGGVLHALRKRCRLIVPELSELGGSDVPAGGLGVRRGVDVVAQLIETEFGGRPVTVAGLSLGGWLGVRLARSRPDLVSRLVLINTGGYRRQDWDAIEKLVRIRDLASVDRFYKALFTRVPLYMRMSRRNFLRAYNSPAVTGLLDRLSEEDTFDDEDLRELRIPTALIWAENDGLFRLETARAMLAALPNGSLEVIPGCGHAVHMERPGDLAKAVLRVRKTTPARPSHHPARVPEGMTSSI